MMKGAMASKGKGKSNPLSLIPASQKVWVGELAEGIEWKVLEEHFNSAGKTKWVETLPKGTACVAYKSDEEAANAIAMLNGTELGGQAIQVDTWTEKPKSAAGGSWGAGPGGKSSWTSGKGSTGKSWGAPKGWSAPTPVWKPAFIKTPMMEMLSKGWGFDKGKGKGKDKGKGKSGSNPLNKIDASLKVWIGNVAETVKWKELEEHFNQVAKTKWTEVLPKGVACVAFETAEEATQAIAMLNGTELGGQVIEVDTWTQKEKA